MESKNKYHPSVIQFMKDMITKGNLCMLEEVEDTSDPLVVGSINKILPFVPNSSQRKNVMICHLREVYSFDASHRKYFRVIFIGDAAKILKDSDLRKKDLLAILNTVITPEPEVTHRPEFFSHAVVIGNGTENNVNDVYCRRNMNDWTKLKDSAIKMSRDTEVSAGNLPKQFKNTNIYADERNVPLPESMNRPCLSLQFKKYNKAQSRKSPEIIVNQKIERILEPEIILNEESKRIPEPETIFNQKIEQIPGPEIAVQEITMNQKIERILDPKGSNILTKWPSKTYSDEFVIKVSFDSCHPSINAESSESDTLTLINGCCECCFSFFTQDEFLWVIAGNEKFVPICPKCNEEDKWRDLDFVLIFQMILKDEQGVSAPCFLMQRYAEKFFECSAVELSSSMAVRMKVKKKISWFASEESKSKSAVMKIVPLKSSNFENQFHVTDINVLP